MLFSSIPFLYYFLPAVLLLYFIAPKKLRNAVILLSSLFFYAWGEPKYVILMAVSITIGYILGLLIEKFREKTASKIFLAISVIFSVGALGYFKYADFFISNFNAVTGLSVSLLRIALPIGISFYTFQLLSYTIDVYRGDTPAQKNPITLAAYISLFPQLIAGPIVRYSDVALQLENRTHSFSKTSDGIRRFILGLSKKILIANALGELCDIFRASEDKSVLFFWLYAVAFTLHIYFDFSGYSDMAIGLGKIMGFEFMENFNYPYISKSVTEFWRRWHISLGSWFRDYVYIPLGGNRCSKPRQFFNILVVWLLTGFWHGAAWTFIIWGLYFALFLLLEKFFLKKFFEKIPRIFSHIYVLVAVMISFVVFNAASLAEAVSDIGGMFGALDIPLWSKETAYYLSGYGVLFVVSIFGATPLIKTTVLKLNDNKKACAVINVLEPIAVVAILIVVTACFANGSFSPFLYFRF